MKSESDASAGLNANAGQAGSKVALITGVTGPDGAYLSELLLGKGYVVHGIKRRTSQLNTGRIDHLYHAVSFFIMAI